MKAAVFPYMIENKYIIDGLTETRSDLEICAAVIPGSFRSDFCEIRSFDKIEDVWEEVDLCIFLPGTNNDWIYDKMCRTIEQGINVECALVLSAEQCSNACKLAQKSESSYTYYYEHGILDYVRQRNDPFTHQECIYIVVGALTKGLNTSGVMSELFCAFKKTPYKVNAICTSLELAVLGMDYLPIDEIIESDLDKSIVFINQYMNYFQYRKHSDIVLIQLPDEGIMRLGKTFESCFGARTYLFSQAIEFDYGILVAPEVGIEKQGYELMCRQLNSRYGVDINCVYISDLSIDYAASADKNDICYYRLPEDISKLKKDDYMIAEGDKILFAGWDEDWAGKYVKDIIR